MADYGAGSKLLHRIALGVPTIARASFDVEWLFQGAAAPDSRDGAHVFVSGLARAGTTILLKALFGSRAFCSLTYRDMPFVLAPNLWAKVAGHSRTKSEAKERIHGDGILVDVDSPEALEEVFWRVMTRAAYIRPDSLIPQTANDEVIDWFRRYVSLILMRYGGTRYLSKNNNNLLRIPSLLNAFPNATVVVPFRHPVDHAASLLDQHRLISNKQKEDPFTKSFMDWLVHHEFGVAHRPFRWPDRPMRHGDAFSVDCWLEQWVNAYYEVLAAQQVIGNAVMLVDYDSLCADPEKTFAKLAARLEIGADHTEIIHARPRRPATVADNELLEEATVLHGKLKGLAL